MSDQPSKPHLESEQIAAYVDRSLPDAVRRVVESHLASCADCRHEVVQVSRIVQTLPIPRWVAGSIGLAAAAAVIVLLLPLAKTERPPIDDGHRDAAVTTTAVPRPVAPRGTVDSAKSFVWSAVPYADAYRVRLYDANGTVVWESEGVDTVVHLPPSLAARPGRPYYWKVEARTGFDRWAASDLVEFTVTGRSEP